MDHRPKKSDSERSERSDICRLTAKRSKNPSTMDHRPKNLIVFLKNTLQCNVSTGMFFKKSNSERSDICHLKAKRSKNPSTMDHRPKNLIVFLKKTLQCNVSTGMFFKKSHSEAV